jgi:hypothetical protein
MDKFFDKLCHEESVSKVRRVIQYNTEFSIPQYFLNTDIPRIRAGSVSVFQVGVGYQLFFRLFFQVGRFSVSVFIKISVSVSVSVFYAAQFT